MGGWFQLSFLSARFRLKEVINQIICSTVQNEMSSHNISRYEYREQGEKDKQFHFFVINSKHD